MGSSAEAIVAGIAAAAAFAQEDRLNRDSIFELAAAIEGHPDNVAPAVYGGMTVSWNFDTAEGVGSVPIPGGDPLHGGFHTVKYAVDPGVTAAVFVPDYELSTEKAREALPGEVAYRDAVFNVSRVALMAAAMNPRALASGEEPNALLYAATQDRLHQPYRKGLMQPSWDLIQAFRSRGFAAMVSGAGPCVLVLHHATPWRTSMRSRRNSWLPAIGRCCTCPSTRSACRSSVSRNTARASSPALRAGDEGSAKLPVG